MESDGDHANTIAYDLAEGIGAQVNWGDVVEIPARTVILRNAKVAA